MAIVQDSAKIGNMLITCVRAAGGHQGLVALKNSRPGFAIHCTGIFGHGGKKRAIAAAREWAHKRLEQ